LAMVQQLSSLHQWLRKTDYAKMTGRPQMRDERVGSIDLSLAL